MASMGMLGAVSGAAGGMAKIMMGDIEEARNMRLEQLRSTNARETNKMNNDQRHANSMEQAAKGQEYSLAELAARGEQDTAQMQAEADLKKSQQPQFEDVYDDSGAVEGQRNSQTNEYKPVNRGANAPKTPDKLVIADALKGMGIEQDKIANYITGDKSQDEIRRELTMDLGKDSLVDPDDIPGRVDQLMQLMYPEAAELMDAVDQGGDIPTVNSPEEARSLPPGSQFKTPDGRIMRVPAK